MNSIFQVTFLGTGAGDYASAKFKTSLLCRAGNTKFLLDAGAPCVECLIDQGVAPEEVEAVFLSHSHNDHVGGVFGLVQRAWVLGRTTPLPCYLPNNLMVPMMGWLEALGMRMEKLTFGLKLQALRAGEIIRIGDASVRPFVTTHQVNPGWESFGFVLEGMGRKWVFSGDLGSMEDLREVLHEPLDALVCELAHVTPQEMIGLLRDKSIGMLLITHVGREWNERIEELREELNNALPLVKEVFFAADGESFVI